MTWTDLARWHMGLMDLYLVRAGRVTPIAGPAYVAIPLGELDGATITADPAKAERVARWQLAAMLIRLTHLAPTCRI